MPTNRRKASKKPKNAKVQVTSKEKKKTAKRSMVSIRKRETSKKSKRPSKTIPQRSPKKTPKPKKLSEKALQKKRSDAAKKGWATKRKREEKFAAIAKKQQPKVKKAKKRAKVSAERSNRSKGAKLGWERRRAENITNLQERILKIEQANRKLQALIARKNRARKRQEATQAKIEMIAARLRKAMENGQFNHELKVVSEEYDITEFINPATGQPFKEGVGGVYTFFIYHGVSTGDMVA